MIDAEVSRHIGWFVQNRRELAKQRGGDLCSKMILCISHNVILYTGCTEGQIIKTEPMIRDNEPCICGSGRKWKKCCRSKHDIEG